MNALKWSADFGLYKEYDVKKSKSPMKFVIVASIIGFAILGTIYTAYYLSSHQQEDYSPEASTDINKTLERRAAEKLTSSYQFAGDEITEKQPPRPFSNIVLGPPPSEFKTTTEKTTTTLRPRINNHFRNPQLPKNIQDVISYVSISARKPTNIDNIRNNILGEDIVFERFKQTETQPIFVNDLQTKKNTSFQNLLEKQQDPFYSYKPQDPSDINLLATHGLRFSPPIWSSIRNQKQAKRHPIFLKDVDNQKETSTKNKVKKPYLVTLNIYPTENENPQEHRFNMLRPLMMHHGILQPAGSQMIFPKTTPPSAYKMQKLENQMSGMKNGDRLSKMIIHLRLIPEPSLINESFKENSRKESIFKF